LLYFSNNIWWYVCVVTTSWHHVINFLHILHCSWKFCVYLCVWHLCIFLDCHIGFCTHLCVCVCVCETSFSHFSKLWQRVLQLLVCVCVGGGRMCNLVLIKKPLGVLLSIVLWAHFAQGVGKIIKTSWNNKDYVCMQFGLCWLRSH
jgi:hypothetical protein